MRRDLLTVVKERADIAANPDADAFHLVPDLELGEELINRGVPSSHVLNQEQGSETQWSEVIRRGNDPAVAPPTPLAPGLDCLVILPTYNECQNLENMVRAISRHLVTDILIVDDNSPDGTGEIADTLAAKYEYVHVIHRPGKLGLGTAYIAGFRWGLDRDYDRLIEMDCDFSHNPADLPRLVHASKTADLVIGSRYVRGGSTMGWDLRRRLLSKGANLYTKVFLGPSLNDWTAGFRCYNRDRLGEIELSKVTASGYSFQIQMAWLVKRVGGVVREIPIHFAERNEGQSKMSGGIAMEALVLVPTLRFRS